VLQLGKGLEFLHESAGLVHANLTPEAVLVNGKGDWKIAGLGFCGPHESSTAATSLAPISLHEVLNHDPRLPRTVQLNIDYTSPDFVLDNNLAASADMFSLGLVILALYNSPHSSPLSTGGSVSSYKRLFSSSSVAAAVVAAEATAALPFPETCHQNSALQKPADLSAVAASQNSSAAAVPAVDLPKSL
jgi:SCY1-like protein 2